MLGLSTIRYILIWVVDDLHVDHIKAFLESLLLSIALIIQIDLRLGFIDWSLEGGVLVHIVLVNLWAYLSRVYPIHVDCLLDLLVKHYHIASIWGL